MNTEKEKLVLDNTGLAYKLSLLYFKKFGNIYELDELRSVAYFGLVKAADTFKVELGFKFSTYAYTCIHRELCHFTRDNLRYGNQLYLSDIVEGTDNLCIQDMVASDINLEEDVTNIIQNQRLIEEIEKLPERYRTILKYKLQGLNFVQIGKILGFSQPTIGTDYNRAINILRTKLIDWRWKDV